MSDLRYWQTIGKLQNTIGQHEHYDRLPYHVVENLKSDNSKEAQDLLKAHNSYSKLLNDYYERYKSVRNAKKLLENTHIKRQNLKRSLPWWGTRSKANNNANNESKAEKHKMMERARDAVGYYKTFQKDDILEEGKKVNNAYNAYKAYVKQAEQAQPKIEKVSAAEQARLNAQAESQEAYKLLERLKAEREAKASKEKSQGGSRKRSARSKRTTHRRKTYQRKTHRKRK